MGENLFSLTTSSTINCRTTFSISHWWETAFKRHNCSFHVMCPNILCVNCCQKSWSRIDFELHTRKVMPSCFYCLRNVAVIHYIFSFKRYWMNLMPSHSDNCDCVLKCRTPCTFPNVPKKQLVLYASFRTLGDRDLYFRTSSSDFISSYLL